MAEGGVWADPDKARVVVQEVKERKRWVWPNHSVRKRLEEARARPELTEAESAEGRARLVERARVLQPLAHGVVGLDPALELLDLLHYHPGLVRVGPHAALGHGVLQLGQPLRLPVYVKGSS